LKKIRGSLFIYLIIFILKISLKKRKER